MKQYLRLIGIFVFIILVAGVFFYLSSRKEQTISKPVPAPASDTSQATATTKPSPDQVAIYETAWKNDAATVKNLLAKGVNPNFIYKGKTPLHVAAHVESLEIATLLLEHGALVDAKETWHNETPLYEAASRGSPEIVQLFLEHGADPNAMGVNGWSPLYIATDYGCERVVAVLIRYGADVNIQTDDGETPLHAAAASSRSARYDEECRGRQYYTALVLLAHGADPNIANNKGETPLDYVKSHWVTAQFSQLGTPEFEQLLKEHGAKRGT